ncbi:MAG: potassium channel protein [Dactylosporangium sp.]|nr:NAD-binding protein [Dactylosporangium sp.]NNJ60802.1 potassium channel protein [Dactylosporangium sp.]
MCGDVVSRVIVWGDNALAQRLVAELMDRYAVQVTVIVASAAEGQAPDIGALRPASGDPALRPTMLVAPRLTPEVFHRAGLEQAVALALIAQDDVANVDGALIAREVSPTVRIVVRMFHQALAEGVATMLGDCDTLSGSEIAAPAFVAAVLGDDRPAYIRIPGGSLTAVNRAGNDLRQDRVVCGLATTDGSGEPETLPEDDDAADLVLTHAASAPPRRPARRRRPSLPLVRLLWGRRQRRALLALSVPLALGALALAATGRIGSWQAAYLAILTAVGGGDPSPKAPVVQQIAEVFLVISGAAIVPILTAIIVEAIVNMKLAASTGGLTRPVSGHVIVAGLGNVGTRVLRELHDLGLTVVAIDRSPDARGVPVARALGVPVIIGSANSPETLRAASVETCQTLVVLSTDDVSNLEAALLARSIHDKHRQPAGSRPDPRESPGPCPKLRVLLRLFDEDFAARAERAFDIDFSRSVSYLSAPAFAATMMGRDVLGTIPIGRRVLLVAELPVGAGAQLDGLPCAEVNRSHKTRLIAVRGRYGQTLWNWPPRRALVRTERVLVVATRAGLVDLLARTAATLDPPPRDALRRPLLDFTTARIDDAG